MKPELKVGLGGTFYVICDIKDPLIPIAESINKSVNSIYYNKKYELWVIRCKLKIHKTKLKSLFDEKMY